MSGSSPDPDGPRFRPKSFVASVRHALDGLLLGFRSQRHLRVHFAVALLALLGGIFVGLDRLELVLLIFAVSLVIVAELFNSVVETVVDMVTSSYHPLAKAAKDVAAGAVLVTAVTATVVCLLLFLPVERALEAMRAPQPADMFASFVVIALVLFVLVVVGKARGRHGTFLHGGVISGHTALAFALSTCLIIQTRSVFVALVAVFLALIVSQSRVDAGIHSLREVAYGALLGVTVPAVVYLLMPEVAGGIATVLPAAGGN